MVKLVILMDLIVGAPLTMGGKIFKPLRLSARPSEFMFSLSQNVWNFNHLSFCRIHLLWNFIKDVMSNELAWSQYCCESTRAPSSYVSRSLVQYCRYVTSVQFYFQNENPRILHLRAGSNNNRIIRWPSEICSIFPERCWRVWDKKKLFSYQFCSIFLSALHILRSEHKDNLR